MRATRREVREGEATALTTGNQLRHLWTDRLGRSSIRALQVLILLGIATVVVLALVQLKLIVIPVMIATIVAAAFSPLIRWFRGKGMPAMLATWITLIGALAVLGGVTTLIVFAVRNQWPALVESASKGLLELQDFVLGLPLPFEAIDWDAVVDSVVDFITSAQFGSGALAGVSVVAELITGTVLVAVLLFFFLKDGDRIWEFFLLPFRGETLERGRRIGATSVRVLGNYIRGTTIVALVDAVAIGIGLAILQVPLALPLAVIVFFGGYIPLVGATVAGIFAALVALVANGPIVALIVVVLVIAVNQLEGDFLQPVVMGQTLRLHPLVILIALTIGTILGGIVGALLAVPVAAVGWAITRIVFEHDRPADPVAESVP